MPLAEVRLTAQEKEGIRRAVETVCARFGVRWKRIGLFGSRANPKARGGDIDLYVEIVKPSGTSREEVAAALRIALEYQLGERKIDLLVDDGSSDLGAFGDIVKTTKVDLWTTG